MLQGISILFAHSTSLRLFFIETNNPLADEYSGYDNITISQELASPDLELLRTVNENISAGLFNLNFDFLDGTNLDIKSRDFFS